MVSIKNFNMKRIHPFLIALLMLSFISCSDNDSGVDDEPTSLEFKSITNVSYGADQNQKYDIYLPKGRTSETKVMILVHGGGWSTGDKSSMDPIVSLFRSDLPDIALVNINYRLADENNQPYPMQINDITTIINDLKAKKDEYVISEEYGFLGVSAGAHLSLLWSYAFDTNNNVTMVCSIVGPTNFTDPAYLNNNDPVLQELIAAFGINPTVAFLEEVSPYHQVTSSAPPTIMFYGGQDQLVPVSQGTDLRDKLNSLGVTNEFNLYPNAGHSLIDNPLDVIITWVKISAFTNSHL